MKFCQTCCSSDIKSVMVDFTLGQQYFEIDLDQDAYIFPDYGYFITKSNIDSIMDIKPYYKISVDENPTAITNAL